MNQTQANIDFCGIKNLLTLLEKNGFGENELKKISARILARLGADIIMQERKSAA